MIVVRHRRSGEDWSEPQEFSDDRLQELMDRANAAFGDPGKTLGGPNEHVPAPTRAKRRR